ncbi:MAG: PHB depolymerase family esterase [Pyrinomonadaceae bacterium]
MKTLTSTLAIFLVVIGGFQLTGSAQNIEKTLFRSNNKERAYYLFVPEKLDAAKPVPLVVLLHGSGRNGMSLAEKWKDLAKKERFIIAGPDATASAGWNVPLDAPDPLYDLIESLKAKYPINPRRIYLFGHSAGAIVGFYVALMESEYFAAAAVHAGAMRPDEALLLIVRSERYPSRSGSGRTTRSFRSRTSGRLATC